MALRALSFYFFLEGICRALAGFLLFLHFREAALICLIGAVASFCLLIPCRRLSFDLVTLLMGLNWICFFINIGLLFGWESGFHLYATCLLFVLFLFQHRPLRSLLILAVIPLIGVSIYYFWLRGLVAGYSLSEEARTVLHLANLILSTLINLFILLYFFMSLQRQREKLAQLADYRKQLIAGLSHEMKTPIAAMLTHTQVELSALEKQGCRSDFHALMERNLQGMRRLVDRMLDFSRSDDGSLEIHQEEIDPVVLVQECLDLQNQSAENKEQRLELNTKDFGFWKTDPDLLRIAVNNLLSNAIKYSPEKTTIFIEISGPEVGAGTLMGSITIRDKGPGIASENRSKIFEPFYRGDLSRSRAEGSYGLGLPLAKTAVERLGGRIEVESNPGKGSCFSILL